MSITERRRSEGRRRRQRSTVDIQLPILLYSETKHEANTEKRLFVTRCLDNGHEASLKSTLFVAITDDLP